MQIVNGVVQATEVFERLYDAVMTQLENGKRRYTVYVLEGGSRSSKTISIIQLLLLYSQLNSGKGKRIVICRKVGAWLAPTIIFDFIKVLQAYGWYSDKQYHSTKRIYKIHGNEFHFVGLDDPQKLHGMQSDVVWINEAVEAEMDDLDQLEQRCNDFVILDYNPSFEEHWIYDKVLLRDDTFYMHSTMLMNPFLSDKARNKILSYEPTADNQRQGTANKRKWEIYGLGKRAKVEGLILPNYQIIKQVPEPIKKSAQGLDWGFTNDVTAIGDVYWTANDLYLDEQCYRTYMLTKDIVSTLKKVNKGKQIVADSSDPRMKAEVELAGFNIKAVKKFPGSVMAGLQKMQEMNIYVTETSINWIQEIKNYTFTPNPDKPGLFLNEVQEGQDDHLMDAGRYVVLDRIMGKSATRVKSNMFH